MKCFRERERRIITSSSAGTFARKLRHQPYQHRGKPVTNQWRFNLVALTCLFVTGSFVTEAVAGHPLDSSNSPFVNNHFVLTASLPTNGFHKGVPVVVIVDKSSHFTYVLQLQGDKVVRTLTVSNAVGSGDKPTPPGRYTVIRKEMYPEWVPPKTIDPDQKVVPPYNETHKNPLGVAAIYLDKFEIDLHGTNTPGQIRKSVSHGCVRHSNPDILQLYGMVNKGDVVYIINKFRGKVLTKNDFVRTSRSTGHTASSHRRKHLS
jgi:lipoprotein-anchoring transpeptidase ErfK/SrfK